MKLRKRRETVADDHSSSLISLSDQISHDEEKAKEWSLRVRAAEEGIATLGDGGPGICQILEEGRRWSLESLTSMKTRRKAFLTMIRKKKFTN